MSAPVASGWALSLTRPKLLDELMNWADLVLVEFPWQFDYCFRRRGAKPFVLAAHNVEVEKFQDYAIAQGVRPEGNRWLRVIEEMERRAVENARLVLAVSPADRLGFVERFRVDPAKILEVANGSDTNYFTPICEDDRKRAKRELGLPEKPAILFIAGGAPPNRVALRWVEELAQRTDQFTFLALGRVCGHRGVNGALRRIGEVDDFRPYMRASDFSVCPVEYGGGTKIKLMEALAGGLPTVVFREALHGTDLRDGEHVVVAEPNVESLLGALERLAANPRLAERIGRNGRDHVVRNHNWDDIAGRLEAALMELAAQYGVGELTVLSSQTR